MNLTKIQMAQVITKALYMLKDLPAEDHHEVKRMVRYKNKNEMKYWYEKALKVIKRNEELELI